MSLILEALKKSEQQRRLGTAPTFGSPVAATRRRRSLLPVLAILIVIAAAAAWWWMRSPQPAPGIANPATPVPATVDAPADARSRGGASGPDAKRRETLLAQAKTQRAEIEKRAAAARTAAAAAPKTDIKPATSAMAPARPATQVDPFLTSKPGAPGAPAGDAIKPVATTTPATPPAPARPQPAAKSEATVPSVWDLPYSVRKDLPAIDLTMHVYSANPAERFVVVKGERHAEGDDLGSELVLREIRKDGLVLEFKGQKFLFPATGR